jgi:hypothetical protein
MALSNEEKTFIEEALQVYLQLVARQMPPAQVQQLAVMAQGIVKKLDSVGNQVASGGSNKPAGITDEWFTNVCSACDKLTPSGCSDKITEKFPGKCDPILSYENKKRGVGKMPDKSF